MFEVGLRDEGGWSKPSRMGSAGFGPTEGTDDYVRHAPCRLLHELQDTLPYESLESRNAAPKRTHSLRYEPRHIPVQPGPSSSKDSRGSRARGAVKGLRVLGFGGLQDKQHSLAHTTCIRTACTVSCGSYLYRCRALSFMRLNVPTVSAMSLCKRISNQQNVGSCKVATFDACHVINLLLRVASTCLLACSRSGLKATKGVSSSQDSTRLKLRSLGRT